MKYLDIKIIENIKLNNTLNGFGEGICLIITQLLDKYLVNQNFIFKKPQLKNSKQFTYSDEEVFEEPSIQEEFPNGPNGGYSNKTKCYSLNGDIEEEDELSKIFFTSYRIQSKSE